MDRPRFSEDAVVTDGADDEAHADEDFSAGTEWLEESGRFVIEDEDDNDNSMLKDEDARTCRGPCGFPVVHADPNTNNEMGY